MRSRPVAYDELVAVLALGSLVVPVGCEPPNRWLAYGRDAALAKVAPAFGIRLRELHPPLAAAGLAGSAEFPQHFADSYVPLARSALRSGQMLLAWRGWATPCEMEWGLLTSERGDELMGVCGASDAPQPLVGAAHQVYAVESVEAGSPALDATSRFRLAAEHACTNWFARSDDARGWVAGVAAYQRAAEHVASARTSPGARGAEAWQAFAERAAAAQDVIAGWLGRIAVELPPVLREACSAWMTEAAESARLRRSLGATWSSEDGTWDSARAGELLTRAERLESALHERLRHVLRLSPAPAAR